MITEYDPNGLPRRKPQNTQYNKAIPYVTNQDNLLESKRDAKSRTEVMPDTPYERSKFAPSMQMQIEQGFRGPGSRIESPGLMQTQLQQGYNAPGDVRGIPITAGMLEQRYGYNYPQTQWSVAAPPRWSSQWLDLLRDRTGQKGLY